ncbi:hypothetical protein GCM10022232_01170 [Streptomyces plumbiresistens]|uniref:Uncharacterized protein n=1 Tax=Streptomyces plumbiresistens TaxID=511811 RepID=A0ABP7PZG2_9ACTN
MVLCRAPQGAGDGRRVELVLVDDEDRHRQVPMAEVDGFRSAVAAELPELFGNALSDNAARCGGRTTRSGRA